MAASSSPVSLVAERAVRFLREQTGPVDSVTLAREVLATRIADEDAARQVLEAAFGNDPRLRYEDGGWRRARGERPEAEPKVVHAPRPAPPEEPDQDFVLVALQGARPAKGRRFTLSHVVAIRLEGDAVASACGGYPAAGRDGDELRRVVRDTLEGAIPVVHDPPGSWGALERWLDEPVEAPISLRRLAQLRLGLPASHDLSALIGKLGLHWRETDDPVELANTLDACLQKLRQPGEDLATLRDTNAGSPPLDWSRFAFDKQFLREIPSTAGTYRFYDQDDNLTYVGKSKNLHRRIGSYFAHGSTRSKRVKRLLDTLHRIEIEPTGSDLEAMLREAEQIRRDRPEQNTQREVRAKTSYSSRLDSILILEPASAPLVLRAYLIKSGRLLERVGIGPRGGGLRRIERILDDHYFSVPTGPTTPAGPDLDVETVSRWLAANRDRVVAFNPTDLASAQEVTDRLRWFLSQGSPFDTDGSPILTR